MLPFDKSDEVFFWKVTLFGIKIRYPNLFGHFCLALRPVGKSRPKCDDVGRTCRALGIPVRCMVWYGSILCSWLLHFRIPVLLKRNKCWVWKQEDVWVICKTFLWYSANPKPSMYSEVNVVMPQSFWPGMVRDGDVFSTSCPVLKKKSPEIHGLVGRNGSQLECQYLVH